MIWIAAMHLSDLGKVDLNLLLVLHMLIETRSVTKAAQRLGTSQPAVSRSLAKLRVIFNDRLMVKDAQGMMPTRRAEAMSEPLAKLLGGIEEFLLEPKFDPAASDRVFRIATTDYGALAVLPSLAPRLARDAPKAGIEITPVSQDVFRLLTDGQVDVLFYSDNPVPGSFRMRELFQERFVSLVRGEHPLLKGPGHIQGQVSLEAFAAWSHVLVTIFGGPTGPVDRGLAEHGLKRRVAVWVPYFATGAAIAAGSDLIVTMPSRVARRLAQPLGLVELKTVPLVEPWGYRMLWHERTHGDLGAAWFRQLILDSVREGELTPS
jgi:DNA-binding transcriptional LysR family regulator